MLTTQYMSQRGGIEVLNFDAASTAPSVSPTAADGSPGSWAAIGTPSFSYDGFWIVANDGGADDIVLDVGIGAPGSEVLVASKIRLAVDNEEWIFGQSLFIPVRLPAGVPVSVRAQDEGTGATPEILLYGFRGAPMPVFSRMDAIGFSGSEPKGTTLPAASTDDTKTPWVELDPSTQHAYKALAVVIGCEVSFNNCRALVDIGVGPSGSEVSLITNLWTVQEADGVSETTPYQYPFLPVSIPAGSRIAARFQSNPSGTSSLDFDVYINALR